MSSADAAQSSAQGPKVIFRTGPLRGHVLAVERPRVSIGRDHRNDISIADNMISAFHAAIVKDEDGGYWLEDAGSKNGTYLNGEQVQRERLRDGDVFYLCMSGPEIQFTTGEPKLPGIIESSTATFARTRSLTQALRDLLPYGRGGLTSLLKLSGVRRILDYELDLATHRSRVRFLALMVSFFLLAVLALGGTLYIQSRVVSPSVTGGVTADGVGDGLRAVSADGTLVGLPAKLEVKLEPIYGSLFLSYRESPIGKALLTNTSDATVPDSALAGYEIRFCFAGSAASFLVEPYSVVVPEVLPGKTVSVDLEPKLSTEVLSDQTREVTAVVSLIRYGKAVAEVSRGVFVHGRHVFSWEKPERIAAFVDPQDPVVRRFVEDAWAYRPATSRQEFPPPNVVGALTLLTGLAEAGLRYRSDSKNPISALIDEKANDTVNYPGETLLARAGDCDDLSVLSAAVLEAAGIPTALVIGSGHVFFMFDTAIGAANLAHCPLDPGTIVVRGEKVWMPVEATDCARPGANFASAWSACWQHCRAIAAGEMTVVEIREALLKYQPMNPPPDAKTLERIEAAPWKKSALETGISFGLASLKKLFHENLALKIDEIEKSGEAGLAKEQAKGLVYARSGLFDEARRVFEGAVFGDGGPPAPGALGEWTAKLTEETAILLEDLALCLTLGARSISDLDLAARYTETALTAAPEKGGLMLRLALVHRLRGDLSAERSWSLKAFGVDPTLRTTYEALVTGDGSVAGPEDKVLDYLWKGLK